MRGEKSVATAGIKANNREIGTKKERLARWFLEQNGYIVLEMNYRCPWGEVDMIAEKDGYLVFVEVKYRQNASRGYPGAAVNKVKQQKISKVARYYMYAKRCGEGIRCRFDVVEILGNKIRIIENAFDYKGGNR